MYWKELFEDFRKEFPTVPFWFSIVYVTYASIAIPIGSWIDCDFRIFRFKVWIAIRKIFFRIIGGA